MSLEALNAVYDELKRIPDNERSQEVRAAMRIAEAHLPQYAMNSRPPKASTTSTMAAPAGAAALQQPPAGAAAAPRAVPVQVARIKGARPSETSQHLAVSATAPHTTSSLSSTSDGAKEREKKNAKEKRSRTRPRGFPSENRDSAMGYPADYFDPTLFQLRWGDFRKYWMDTNHLIGQGAYGEVYLGRDNTSGRTIVLKTIKPEKEKKEKIQKEVQMIELVQGGPHIVDFIELVRDPKTDLKMLVFEYVENPPYKLTFERFTPLEARAYLFKLACALEFVHSKGIIHRDIKGGNVLFNPRTAELRLIDWGFAEFYRPNVPIRGFPGTRSYKAPELWLAYPYYDYAVDMWAYACVLGAIIFQRTMFKSSCKDRRSDQAKRDQLVAIADSLGTEDYEAYISRYSKAPLRMKNAAKFRDLRVNREREATRKKPWERFIDESNRMLACPDAIDLLDLLLKWEHEDRGSAREVLEHRFFDPIRNEAEGPRACLPPGWERCVDSRPSHKGRVYYTDHNSGTTHWVPPSS